MYRTSFTAAKDQPKGEAASTQTDEAAATLPELADRLKKAPRQCPNCASTHIDRAGSNIFTFNGARHCPRCGCIWTPAWPLWGGAVALILGVALMGAGLGVLVVGISEAWRQGGSSGPPFGLIFRAVVLTSVFTLLGVIMARQGIGVLRGTRGKVAVFDPGNKEQGG